MNTTFASETKVTLSSINKSHPDLHSVSLRTLNRWALKGARGAKLETVRIGGRVMTSAQAVERFIAALNAAPAPAPAPAPRSPHARTLASRAAADELAAVGA